MSRRVLPRNTGALRREESVAIARTDGVRTRKCANEKNLGAGEGARTLDPDLGKVVLYH